MIADDSLEKLGISNLNVLVMDDDLRMLNLLRNTLRIFGFAHVSIAKNFDQAWNHLQTEHIDLIISDWEIKGGKNGIGLIRDVRNHLNSPNRRLPIIMLTGKAELKNVMEAKEAGVTEFLSKPFTVEALKDRIIMTILKKRKEDLTQQEVSVITQQQVNDAQQTIDNSKEKLIKEIQEDVQALEELYNELNHKPSNIELLEGLMDHSLTVKSHSGMLGYPFATSVAKSLYNFTTDVRDLGGANEQALTIIKSHVQTIDVIYRQNIQNDGGEVGRKIVSELTRATTINEHPDSSDNGSSTT